MPSRVSPELDIRRRNARGSKGECRFESRGPIAPLANSIFSMAKRFRSTARALDLRREIPLFHPQALRFLHIGIF